MSAGTAVLTDGRVGGVAFTVVGEGSPVTVFAHGLGGSSAETRPLASRTGGTRVLLDFRGHGTSDPLVDGWDYDLLAEDLLAVADATGASWLPSRTRRSGPSSSSGWPPTTSRAPAAWTGRSAAARSTRSCRGT